MKLFGKKQGFSNDKLDVPPAPPPLYNQNQDLSDLPPLELPPAPEFKPVFDQPNAPQPQTKKFGLFKKKEKPFQPQMPEFPDMPAPDFNQPEMPSFDQPMIPETKSPGLFKKKEAPMPQIPQFPEMPAPTFNQPPMQEPVFPSYNEPFHPAPQKKSSAFANQKFLRVEKYSQILEHIKDAKNIIKDQTNVPENVEVQEKELARLFESWKNSMKDIQKKLLFIDKILFKG
ncbi:MAG: hypothetical protein KJ601_04795 [Nanoarchaeota archaeon]|nr:hypothetical protein [Nanoarchaeota archaeon]MBU1704536.1 hypothetical protein [Nanoarchaeota archaeon]